MPRLADPLTPSAVANAKPKAEPYRMPDGRGLFLLVQPSGAKWWRWKYRRPDGRENILSLDTYPDVSLRKAREKRDEARALLADGIDPGARRQEMKAAKVAAAEAAGDTFEAMALAWLARQDCADITLRKSRWIMETFLFPEIGTLPLAEVTPRVLLAALRKIEETGKLETAKRAKIKAGQVFRWAILEGKAETDPTASLRGALKPPKNKHHAAITDPARMGELLRAIDGFTGQAATLLKAMHSAEPRRTHARTRVSLLKVSRCALKPHLSWCRPRVEIAATVTLHRVVRAVAAGAGANARRWVHAVRLEGRAGGAGNAWPRYIAASLADRTPWAPDGACPVVDHRQHRGDVGMDVHRATVRAVD